MTGGSMKNNDHLYPTEADFLALFRNRKSKDALKQSPGAKSSMLSGGKLPFTSCVHRREKNKK
jgi:hypothetical protein